LFKTRFWRYERGAIRRHVAPDQREARAPPFAKTPVTARALLKTAKQGGYPAFLADLRDDNGAPISFFGAPARSTVFPALLARTTGLPLYAGAAFRRPNVRFTILVKRIPIPETNDREADAVVATAAMHKQFEAFIRDAPNSGCGPTGSGIRDPGADKVEARRALYI
jgi:lauroyl/myristoyl acyltransferase